MADTKINLRILTPTREFFNNEVNMIIMRTTNGDLGVLKGHTPLTTTLTMGALKIEIEKDTKFAALSGGFVEITPDNVTMITDDALWPDEIDYERAERAKERAENRLAQASSDIDFIRAENALKRSLARLHVYNSIKGQQY